MRKRERSKHWCSVGRCGKEVGKKPLRQNVRNTSGSFPL